MSVRGDRERDLAALEAEYAHEHRRRAESCTDNLRRDALLEAAGLHAEATQLLERLGRVYDQIDDGSGNTNQRGSR